MNAESGFAFRNFPLAEADNLRSDLPRLLDSTGEINPPNSYHAQRSLGWMDVWSRGDGLSPSFLLTCRQQFVKPPPTSDDVRSNAAAQELMIAIEAGCTGNREGGALKGLRVESLVHTSKYQIRSEIAVNPPPIPSHPVDF